MNNTPEPKIIYEDNDLVILDKPCGMVVNKADTTKDIFTLQDWVESKFKSTNVSDIAHEKKTGEQYNPQFEFYSRSGIVHRLDKETSGIIIVAKNVSTFVSLQKQFKERTVKKTYIALVHGRVIPADGEISAPVGRLPYNRMHFGVVVDGREAVTSYKTINAFEKSGEKSREILTLLELNPKSGRTHQIRVHLKYINHPIVSDSLYAGRKTGRDDRLSLPRLFLHAAKIEFTHPSNQKILKFESPLTIELTDFLGQLHEIK